jgi:hypothetical protein
MLADKAAEYRRRAEEFRAHIALVADMRGCLTPSHGRVGPRAYDLQRPRGGKTSTVLG